jgi:glucose-6-phosphate isomerase
VIRCDTTVAWRALQGHYEAHGRELDLREPFARDAGRFNALSLQALKVFADLSKNRWDLFTRKLLIELAHECGMPARRDAMFAGEPINTTEGRAVPEHPRRRRHWMPTRWRVIVPSRETGRARRWCSTR